MSRHTSADFVIRLISADEEEFLKVMLFQAIYLPTEEKRNLSRDIINHPDLKKYHEHWGRAGDLAMVAVDTKTGQLVGAAWGRLFSVTEKGYGFISVEIPEISIAVESNLRNRGIGTQLLQQLIEAYKKTGIYRLSLSVSKENPSLHLYQRLKFKIMGEGENDYVMLLDQGAS